MVDPLGEPRPADAAAPGAPASPPAWNVRLADEGERHRWFAAAMDTLLAADSLPKLYQVLADVALDGFGDLAVADHLADDSTVHRYGSSARLAWGAEILPLLQQALSSVRHPTREVLSTARLLRGTVADEAGASRFASSHEDARQLLKRGPFHYVFVPLKAAGRNFGALGIARAGTGFSEADERRIEDLGGRAGLVIQSLLQAQAAEQALQEREAQAGLWQVVSASSRVFAEASLNVSEALQRVSRLVSEHLGGICAIRLLDAEGQWQARTEVYHPDAAVREQTVALLSQSNAMSEGLSARAVASGRSVFLPDLGPDDLHASLPGPLRPHVSRQARVSVMCVPLREHGNSIGVIICYAVDGPMAPEDDPAATVEFRRYTESDLRLCEELADLASLALDHARLYEMAQEARRQAEQDAARTSRLQQITSLLSVAESPDLVLETVLTHGGEALGAAIGMIRTLSSDGLYLEERGRFGRFRGPVVLGSRLALSRRDPVTEVMRTGESLFIENPEQAAASYPWLADQIDQLPESGLVAPLLVGGRPIGAVSFAFDGPRPLATADRVFVGALAAQTAAALERASLQQARQQALAQAEASLDQANEAVQMRDEFLSMASHELRTPLTSLKLQLDAVLRKIAAEPDELLPARALHAKLQRLNRQAERLSNLIVELLDVARSAQGRLPLAIEEVDLREVVREVADRHAEELSRQGCALWLQCAPAVGAWDRSRLDQVVTNLLSNALKYGAGHPITVTTTVDGDEAVLMVKDQGIGIAAENHERVFGRFERVVSTRNYGGFGIGLWIVREIVQGFQGRITLDSTAGHGASFIVRLPLHAAVFGVADRP